MKSGVDQWTRDNLSSRGFWKSRGDARKRAPSGKVSLSKSSAAGIILAATPSPLSQAPRESADTAKSHSVRRQFICMKRSAAGVKPSASLTSREGLIAGVE
jgi:hypothetical protein